MKRANATYLRHTAYHEAGHAVIGRVTRQVCGQATIVPNEQEGEAGHAICADPLDTFHHWDRTGRWRGNEMRSIFRGRIIAVMAGSETETEFFGSCTGGDGEDRYQIDCMLDSMLPAGADVACEEQRLRRHTRALVRRHRDKIARVAQLLLKKQTLSPEMISAAIGIEAIQDKENHPSWFGEIARLSLERQK